MHTRRSNAADFSGSTEFIKDKINASAPGSTWAVGTEISLVNRIAAENPDKNIFCLDPVVVPAQQCTESTRLIYHGSLTAF
ncbi:MAG: hypothetical protein CM1200mP3_04850 [Chloroflexota bacterium]|nr:MAG: hypothetical protein CM1200mP3_04850 [Chloroflexota bacterium]